MKILLAVSSVALTMALPCTGQEGAPRSLAANQDTTHCRKGPADKITVGGHDVVEILGLLGAKLEPGATDSELLAYTKPFDRLDANGDGKHSKKEYIDDGAHMDPQARRGIFAAADNNDDGFVTRTEYVLNRIITDEAKGIVQATDADKDGKVTRAEFIDGSPLKEKQLAAAVFDVFDSNSDGTITIPEYLRVWGGWARPNYKKQEAEIRTRLQKLENDSSVTIDKTFARAESAKDRTDFNNLWSYSLISRRTGEPLIREGDEHRIDKGLVSYGYNIVVDRNGQVLSPGSRPLQGGEKLVLTKEYQQSRNVREYARVVSFMAPIRDAILYNFEHTSKQEWMELTQVLRVNNIKTKDAPTITPRSILSIEQVYDYVASGPTEGSPVMRFLEEAELELKCLGFIDFDFTNPEGRNHAKEHNIKVGSGIKLP